MYHIDAARVRGVAAYFNHRCFNANVKIKQLFSGAHKDPRAVTVALFATEDIQKGTPMTFDYKQGSLVKGSVMFERCFCLECSKRHASPTG